MALTKGMHPYEFLARWDKDGNLAGAHVGFREVIIEDGEVTHERVEPVMPVDVGQGQGFPLTDILDQLQADTLAVNAALTAERDSLKSERDQLAADKAALEAELAKRLLAPELATT